MEVLIERAKACDKHVMVAAIESGNAASIRLHERAGFVTTGQMPQVGTKFGAGPDLHAIDPQSWRATTERQQGVIPDEPRPTATRQC
jgi:L-amino acid N-acyltransferase YncA